MKTTSTNGYLFVNLCSKPGHKRYQNVFEDTDECKTYIYETDHPAFKDGISDIENDCDDNSYTNEGVKLTFAGDEPTQEEFDRYDNAKQTLHLAAEKAMIQAIKENGEVSNL